MTARFQVKVQRDAIRYARAQLAIRFKNVDFEHEINQHFSRHGETYCSVVVRMLDGYERALDDGTCPMRTLEEWGRELGLGEEGMRRHWKTLRRWRIDGVYVWHEGIHALRTGTYHEGPKGERVKITAGGIGLRTADMPPLPPQWLSVVVASTAEGTRVMNETTGNAANTIIASSAATPEQKAVARETRAASLNSGGQLPLRVVRTGTDGK